VIARNSSFTYKGKAVDIKQIGRELGVRYVLEGSVRKVAQKIRIIGQLIDAATGRHIWADQFEGDLGDIFALQDRITETVVSAILPRMFQTEINLAVRRPNNLSAYDLWLRAYQLQLWTRGGSAEALRLASCALQIDPRCGRAATLAGECHIRNVHQRWAADPVAEIAEGFRLLRLALSIDGNDYLALGILGRETADVSGDFETAKEMVDRAVALNPNSNYVWLDRGWTYLSAGELEEAIRSFERALRLSPFDPWRSSTFAGMSAAFIGLGRFDETFAAAKKALRESPFILRESPFTAIAYRCLASTLVHLGREAEAREAAAGLLELEPNFRISEWVTRKGISEWAARTRQFPAGLFIDSLRKAGLPE